MTEQTDSGEGYVRLTMIDHSSMQALESYMYEW